jgi:hypothetical protein
MVQKIKRYGWVPDLPDARDHMYAAPAEVMTNLPPKVDLSGGFPDAFNQGDLGSCSGNAIAGAIQFERRKQNLNPDFIPSRLFMTAVRRFATASNPLRNRACVLKRNGITTKRNSP